MALLWMAAGFRVAPASAQPAEEIVANLSTGRVLVCVARDGIAIGAVERRTEAGSRPPVIVPLSRQRVAVLLGAVEWVDPAGGPPRRLEQELPRLTAPAPNTPRLSPEQGNDIEALGLAVLEWLRTQTGKLHRNLHLREEEPLVEMLLVGYVEGYGPEAWSLRYFIVQEPLRGDSWRTRILRPRYTQLYPPEKGEPRTLIEVRHPDTGEPRLLHRLPQDPALARARTADPQLAQTSALVERGESPKAKLEDLTEWLRAVLHAATPPEAAQVFGVIHAERGFEWILPPAEPPARATDEQPRDPRAPTLRRKP